MAAPSYAEFLARKNRRAEAAGPNVPESAINPLLHGWQRKITRWALRTGRAALWEDTGLGKTFQSIEWCRHAAGRSLIVAPLAVCEQTVREAAKLGVTARYARSDAAAAGPGIWVTNYEMAPRFDPGGFGAVVLDEASILKQSDGKTRTALIRQFAGVRYRLACTATPAPNDVEELTNQAEFLGVMPRAEMLATFFVHDSDGWRLKGHARGPLFSWMASWAVAIRRPSDLGYPDGDYELPPLAIEPHLLPVDVVPEGQLFATDLGGVGGRAAVRKATLAARCDEAIRIVNASHKLAAVGAKLATWDGSLSTPPAGAPSTSPIPPNENGARPRGDRPRSTASTCAATTRATGRSGSERQNGGLPSTSGDANATRTTLNTGKNASGSPGSGTKSQSGTTGFVKSSASPPQSTTPSLNSKADAAPSAAARSQTSAGTGSTLITTTGPAVSGGSSAAVATSVSASSRTTQSSLPARSTTSSAAPEPWIVWVGRNDEQEYLERAFGDRCFSVLGNQSPEEKAEKMLRWVDGERPILLTKPAIAGFGMNFQHCARMIFVGLSDSYEQYYQAIRRCHRYGQHRPVTAHVVLSQLEGQIAENLARKEREAQQVTESLVREMRSAAHWGKAA